MNRVLLLAVLALATLPVRAQEYRIDAATPAGLRELLRATGEPLPLLSAHRGGAGPGWPENCLATFAETLRHGWAILEIDLRTTRDGVHVLMHDATLDRTTDGTGPVRERTWAELRELRLKDRNGKLTPHRIPSLDEVMTWARGRALLALDKKEVPVAEVVRVITHHRAESYALFMAYTAKEAKEVHAANPEIMMEVMLGTPARFDEFVATGVPWDRVIAFVGHTPTPDRELCRRIVAKGANCMAGTSRNLDLEVLRGRVKPDAAWWAGYRALLERDVAVIETDVPRELAPWLRGGGTPAGTGRGRFLRFVGP